jgi:hypothetical protein
MRDVSTGRRQIRRRLRCVKIETSVRMVERGIGVGSEEGAMGKTLASSVRLEGVKRYVNCLFPG